MSAKADAAVLFVSGEGEKSMIAEVVIEVRVCTLSAKVTKTRLVQDT